MQDAALSSAAPQSTPEATPEHRTYAEWFVWAHRNLSSSDEVCHACAKAAVDAMARGEDPQEAARKSARFRHGAGWTEAASPYTMAYAEWFDWARKHLGTDPEAHHRAATAAMEVLDRGGETNAAAEAAQAAAHARMNETLAQAAADAPHPHPEGGAPAA